MRRQIGFVVLMAVIAGSAGRCVGWAKDEVTIAPAPSGEQLSDDFQVNVDGQPAPVYRCRVSAVPLNQGGGVVYLHDCSDSVIDGIVMRDPDVWCCWLRGCRNARIANVKLVGLWRYNSDGIDLCNSRDITVRDCFVRAFDDCIVLKGLKGVFNDRPVHNVDVRGCVIWNDWGRALEIGSETSAPEIAQVTFRDCDIIRTVHAALAIQHIDRAAVHDIRFENIRMEIDDAPPLPRAQRFKEETYVADPTRSHCPKLVVVHIAKSSNSKDDQRGTVRNVVFKDITVTGCPSPDSQLRGFDADHGVEGILFENVRIHGRPVTDADAGRIAIGPHVRDVKFLVPDASAPAKE